MTDSVRRRRARHSFALRLVCLIAALALLPAASRAGIGTGNCSIPGAEAATCAGIDFFDQQGGNTWIFGVSGDGSTLVGRFGNLPARWVDGELATIPLPPGFEVGEAGVVSRNGSALAGVLLEVKADAGPSHKFHWEASEGFTLLDLTINEAHWLSDMSPDGEMVVGQTNPNSGINFRAFRWKAGTTTYLSGNFSGATATTNDTTVGHHEELGPVRWDLSGAAQIVGDGSGDLESISPDGRIIVGSAWTATEQRGVRWDDGVATWLGSHPLLEDVRAVDLSADGSLIVGTGDPYCHCGWLAVVWQDGAPRLLKDVLAEDFGLGVGTYRLDSVDQTSDDGRVLTGRAVKTVGGIASYVAVLSPKLGIDVSPGDPNNVIKLAQTTPITVVVFGSDQTEIADLDEASLAFGPAGGPLVQELAGGDFNGDGFLDRKLRFSVSGSGLTALDTRACLSGRADGYPFRVCSAVTMQPPGVSTMAPPGWIALALLLLAAGAIGGRRRVA